MELNLLCSIGTKKNMPKLKSNQGQYTENEQQKYINDVHLTHAKRLH